MLKIKRALISVSDKTGLEGLVRVLSELGVEIISTGGTAKAIKAYGIPVKDVSDYTGFPEIMDGRVKTLHPKIHGGLLCLRDNENHKNEARHHGIEMIDMVVVNLYPFEKTVAKKDIVLEEAIEFIDIGGPSMLRSAAKNYKSVAVLSNPERYPEIIKELRKNKGSLDEMLLKSLAVEVFKRSASYDRAICDYMASTEECGNEGMINDALSTEKNFPNSLTIKLEKVQNLRYGENPHQKAALYKNANISEEGLIGARQLQGKELSFNNIMDLNAAILLVKEFKEPAAVIIKHMNPCGVATAKTPEKAYINALACDKMSAFGSIVGFNRIVEKKTAETILKLADFVECIVSPSFSSDAKKIFLQKKNLRLIELKTSENKATASLDFRKLEGGFLVEDSDVKKVAEKDLKTVTKKRPSKRDLRSLLFAWKAVKHVKSNAIVLAKDTRTVGIGAGQMSRVDSVMLAVKKAGKSTRGSVLASDAFFPKEDSISKAHTAGIRAIIQPGGSIRDKQVIEACNKFGIAMVFTGTRHFRH